MSQQKRKRVVPTIQQKIDIIKQLDEGISVKELALKYNIGSTTVHDVKKNRDKLLKFSIATSDSIFGIQHRRTMKKSPHELLHKAMLQWFNKERAEGRPVNGPMCVKQARILFETLGMKGNFDASSGWLARFKDRHGIRTIGDSMECLWTKSNTEKVLKLDESNKIENSQEEESSLNASIESSRKLSSLNYEAIKNYKSYTCFEKSVQNQTVEDTSFQPAINNTEENLIDGTLVDKINSASKQDTYLTDFNSVVRKLEAISEKLTTCDSYDQFGTYITSLLRGLPKSKALIFKQKIVNDILDAIISHEKGLDENSLISANFNKPLTNRSPDKSQNQSFPDMLCNTTEASNLLLCSKIRQLPNEYPQCSPSKKLAEPAGLAFLSNNIGRPAADTIKKTYVTKTSQGINDTYVVSKSDSFETINRAKKRKAPKRQTNNNSNTSDVEGTSSGMEPICTSGDFDIDIEEGKELGELKEDREMFEAVFCEDNLFVQVKEEPLEPDPEESLSTTRTFLCDLCETPCISSTELLLHFTQLHTGCVPTCRAQFEGSLT
uniref:HTH CENPB-type domain-containing protein n=1 Tax=Cuerna arida TaxID=1464854 RepID=A0A1B6GUJ2_9HEMI